MPAAAGGAILPSGAEHGSLDSQVVPRRRTSLGACAHVDRPPLGALYRPTRETLEQPPLIVIPGAFGSRLRDRRSGREIWPGSSAALIASSFRALEVAIDPSTLAAQVGDVEAFDIFTAGLGQDIYGQVLRTLEEVGGYARCGEFSMRRADRRNYYVYPYDFRLSNVHSARGLHALIERIRADYGDGSRARQRTRNPDSSKRGTSRPPI